MAEEESNGRWGPNIERIVLVRCTLGARCVASTFRFEVLPRLCERAPKAGPDGRWRTAFTLDGIVVEDILDKSEEVLPLLAIVPIDRRDVLGGGRAPDALLGWTSSVRPNPCSSNRLPICATVKGPHPPIASMSALRR